ncbi:MAG: putative peptidoglycan glycosyltransferase FtsW [bacterium]|nr:putative peptidoglycan glycosyltransferase FtsW [bacterium]
MSKKPDYLILCLFSILLIFGLFVMGTTSFAISLQNYGNIWYLFLHQLIMVVIGGILGIVAYKSPVKFLRKIGPVLFLINVILIFLVFIPGIGIEAKGALRQIHLPGFSGFSFQPSEFLKITFILYLAAWLASRGQHKKENALETSLWPFLIIMGTLFAGLILQPDMTTLAIICLIGASMYLASKAPLWHFAIMAGIGAIGFSIATILEPYRLNRIISMFKSHSDPMGNGLQLIQAKIAIGSGGILGVGTGLALGLSRQKFFLPESITDSIFAIVAEELGFLGALFLISLILFICFLGLKIAKNKGQTFEGFLALGITVWITLQSLANIGGIVGVLPLGGIPLPFFSYGGSHIIAELIGVGLLLNVSKKA